MLHQKDFTAHTDVAFNDITGHISDAPAIAHRNIQAETTDLEMPASVWIIMFGAYAIFFAGLISATAHDGGTVLVIAISILYTIMYFGVASVLFSQNKGQQLSPFARGLAPLQTYTGAMDKGAVFGQILTIPACLALFGVTMAIFRAIIFG